ncbi:MAG: hypothetical protein WKG00_22020 [Polyangiaceae bacterium]
MVGALEGVGLTDEAQALRAAASGATAPRETGSGARIFAGRLPPADAGNGDLWFDPVELTTMVLVPASADLSPDVAGWLALRPCAVWQLRTFMRVGKVVRAPSTPKAYLDPRRLEGLPGRAPATGLWHDEAIAYAHWFGKTLAGRFHLEAAVAFLSPVQLDAILPEGLSLWDGAEYSEGKREAVSRAQLAAGGDDDDNDDDDALGEWARRPDIGFATFVRTRSGLMTEPKRRTYFFDLDGVAPR